ncbi:MAG TPA: tRNA (adenosine(37)-N6)-threonylcarbamoyltransferase complex dimerization subunit type 1 TsaB [Vicinamibacteria bacterium]|jgi:tRNA threonylcarbamoyladenosine biosynthesis protein TsaB|nr:tRNA (adenosine(37)-N6)-threonylcarbamoyltransferase complex dimerization subunit type 1 TsaB [Vicinamibacteria bacterium]
MRVLAIDTTTACGSVAVVAGAAVLGEVRLTAEGGHSRRVVPAVEFLLGSLDLAPRDLEGYAVTVGPGSFTGLRVGISTTQGLALASGRRCLGFSALDVLAARIRGAAPALVAMMNAYRGEVFAALYDAEARPCGPPVVSAPEVFIERLPPRAAFLGEGAELYRSRILSLRPEAIFPERSRFLAGTLGLVAEPRLAAGEGSRPDELRPLYLREAEIRKPAPRA